MRRHGLRNTQEYGIWRGIKKRCFSPNDRAFKRYGARGITMCEEWRNDFVAFYEHIGPRPSPLHSVDRWPNANGNYEPGNVRWATDTEQMRNRPNYNVNLTHEGITKTVAEWAELVGMKPKVIYDRVNNMGWGAERALTEPVAHGRRPSTLSKYKNVAFHKKTNKYFAYTGERQSRRYVGSFDTAEEAFSHTGLSL